MTLEYASSYLCLEECPGLKVPQVCFQAQLLLEEATCEQRGRFGELLRIFALPTECSLADGEESALSTAVGQSQNRQPAAGDTAWRQSQSKTGWTGGTRTKAFKYNNVSTVIQC